MSHRRDWLAILGLVVVFGASAVLWLLIFRFLSLLL
jgi:hypothetical protein